MAKSTQSHATNKGQSSGFSAPSGSMLFAVRVLDRESSRYSPDDAIFEASRKITKRYTELRNEMSFQDAAEQSRAEWLTEYLQSNV